MIVTTLVRHGWHGMYAFTCLLSERIKEDWRKDLFTNYVGQNLWHINTILHLFTEKENEMKQYVELSHPEMKPESEKLTAHQIINNVLTELGVK